LIDMMRLYYGGGMVVTSDEIAEAVMSYAQALARSPFADVVRIPIVQEEDLKQSTASLLIGPSSQLMAVPVDAHGVTGPIDHDLVDELVRRMSTLGTPTPRPQSVPDIRLPPEYE
jgi:hypothetical protein